MRRREVLGIAPPPISMRYPQRDHSVDSRSPAFPPPTPNLHPFIHQSDVCVRFELFYSPIKYPPLTIDAPSPAARRVAEIKRLSPLQAYSLYPPAPLLLFSTLHPPLYSCSLCLELYSTLLIHSRNERPSVDAGSLHLFLCPAREDYSCK